MKQWLDYIPLSAFFIAYKLGNIFLATGVLVAASVLVYGGLWLVEKRLENNHKFILLLTVAFGSLTLILHDEAFIKWKAPVVNWVLAAGFLLSHVIGDKLAIQRMMGHMLELPDRIWRNLNLAWVAFFISLGAANLYVAFHFESVWVDFKVFGSLGLTVAFIVGQMLCLSRYLPQEESEHKD